LRHEETPALSWLKWSASRCTIASLRNLAHTFANLDDARPAVEKATAINLLGGSVRSAATRLNVSTQAVRKWNEKGCMARLVCDRVLAHVVREAIKKEPKLRKLLRLPTDALEVPHEPLVEPDETASEEAVVPTS
jgi:hypothetical protein